MSNPSILWLRQDLRLADQPALVAACEAGAVIPVYVLDDEGPGEWRMGGAQRWYLHHALAAFAAALEARGSRLILRRGRSAEVLREVMAETGAQAIHAIRHYEPWWREAEAALADVLRLHHGNHLTRVEEVRTGSGAPFRIFGSFWRAIQTHLPPPEPLPAPTTIPAPDRWPESDTLDALALLPTIPWAERFGEEWTAGEDHALAAVERFATRVDRYAAERDLPSVAGSARLSAHLHFGEVSPRTVWHAMRGAGEGAEKFLKELAWRDFTSGLIVARPDYASTEGRAKVERMPWRTGRDADRDFAAWTKGRTGYPIVDAGMRHLWATGWLPNRARLLTASFVVKHLLIDWRQGERWFWDTLVDADYGNNAVNWQWVAGTGYDANVFSRIMAPLTQSEKFDAGDYIRRWVPELADVPDPAIHDPEAHGLKPLGYPAKIIGHREGRARALAAAASIR